MLMSQLWGVVNSLMSLFYAGIQVMMPCLPPAPLSTTVIYTDEYMGSWYFVAAAAWEEDNLKSFKATDSSVLHIQKGANNTLTVIENFRIGDQCHKNTWRYFASSVIDPFLFRTDFDTIALIWDGKLINCPSCIIILFMDEDEESSAMLFARNENTPDEVIQEFKSKMECVYMEDFLKAPLKHGYCKLDEAS
ncbi:apolipoprotein M [Cyprinus carpio]|uniref:Apolipoprotein M n=2 Tax=Cyprinus carpio TaxID=7962 RepID=A0A9Q9ZBX1_CYPCA|nr:apolipoprotein M [Cyprinus carpio]XP_018925500.1 apolipoprotein M [Cyprinus carpio]XP_018925501.1 apolipoprotein M [Cyprinus carpio]XP_018925502.1 apolipoprotein M [Cyprinus carpio]